MLSRDRVIQVLRHETPDRIPVYAWVKFNMTPQIEQVFGSVAAFEDRYEFDFAHIFGGPSTFSESAVTALRESNGGRLDPRAALDLPVSDPGMMEDYREIIAEIRHHKQERDRFVYMQTPGSFEVVNSIITLEAHLRGLLEYPEQLRELYRRQTAWSCAFARNCLELGVDMIFVADDWGAQNTLLFSEAAWWEMIYPYHRTLVTAVRQSGGYVGLHSDGNVAAVVDGIVELGYDLVHPWQESAGMSLAAQKARYGGEFVVMGGLDVQSTLGFGNLARVEAEIERVLGLFLDGGLLFCTSHFVQDHCSIEELLFAYDMVYRRVRGLGRARRGMG